MGKVLELIYKKLLFKKAKMKKIKKKGLNCFPNVLLASTVVIFWKFSLMFSLGHALVSHLPAF
uniref:Uncharacterized protein n=1 Tax=Macaca fascicularis TaxID=9541 RepID=A0A7N9CLY3_MACFA